MPDEIFESDNIAYVGETPWHGLGVQVAAGTSGDEMLRVAGLDWPVQSLPVSVEGGDATDYRAIARFDAEKFPDPYHIFQIASNRYKPVQNAEIVDFFREFCEAGHAEMETIGSVQNGAKVWALAKLNGQSTTELAGGDRLVGYMLLATSHDGSLPTIGRPTQVRVVCSNTLSAALRNRRNANSTYQLRHVHTFSESEKQHAREVMGLAIESLQATNELAAQLSHVEMDSQGWEKFMQDLLGAAEVRKENGELTRTANQILAATLDSPGADMASAHGTAWGAVNGVTYWADHSRRAQSSSSRLNSAWFGASENLKTRALQVAAQLAGVAA